MTRAELIRKTVIDISRRRQRAGTGSARSLLEERTTVVLWPDLREVLEDVPWAVVGAVATRLYMPERATRDLDIVIAAEHTRLAHERLASAGWKHLGQLSIGGTSWQSPAGIDVDVLEGRAGWWREAITQAQTNRDAQGLPILPLPYLVLMKFQSGRTVDIGDITRILGQADTNSLEATRGLFTTYEPESLEDLESLILLGQLEMRDSDEPVL